jgi:hypothetical protein
MPRNVLQDRTCAREGCEVVFHPTRQSHRYHKPECAYADRSGGEVPSRTGKKPTFAEALAELATKSATVCPLCGHPEQELIEDAWTKGMPGAEVARLLQRMGIWDNATTETAAKRVRLHMEAHSGLRRKS